MALITTPNIKAAREVQMELMRGDVLQRTISGGSIVVAPPFALWVLSLPLATQTEANARLWMAALVQLSKLSNTFKVTPPHYTGAHAGYAGPSPLVAGAGQLGITLAIDGISPSTATVAKAGDLFEIVDTGEVKMLTADAVASGGACTLQFEPAMRASPSNNGALDFLTPEITMQLASSRATWSVKLINWYDFTIEAVEYIA